MEIAINTEDLENIASSDNIVGGGIYFTRDFQSGKMLWSGNVTFMKNNASATQNFPFTANENQIVIQMKNFLNNLKK